jgi:hypothetical protein
MARLGRPSSPRAASARVVHIKLRLYAGEDDDLIAFFSTIPARLRAEMVKQALRNGVQATDQRAVSDDENVLRALESFFG